MSPRRVVGLPPCPHEGPDGACTCPDRTGWACDRYYCLCRERNREGA
jgi:hypothetical protein